MTVVFDDLVVPKFARVMMYTIGYALHELRLLTIVLLLTLVTIVMIVTLVTIVNDETLLL